MCMSLCKSFAYLSLTDTARLTPSTLPIGADVHVVTFVSMPLRAFDTWRHSPVSASDVLGVCHGFEMVRIDAGPVAAQVVEFHSGRDFPVVPLVHDLVREPVGAFEAETSVSLSFPGCPVPAGVGLVDLVHEADARVHANIIHQKYDHFMTQIDISRLDHDKLSQEVRIRLAARLERLLNAMEILVEGDPRDFSASQLAVYLQTVRLLGDLYQVRERPRDEAGMVSADKVEKLIAAAVEEAVALARAEEREKVRILQLSAVESSREQIHARLQVLRDRRG